MHGRLNAVEHLIKCLRQAGDFVGMRALRQPGRVGGVCIPEGYDYTHLVGNPAKHYGKVPDTKRFDELLTGYDQRLLSDMHILWQVYTLDAGGTRR